MYGQYWDGATTGDGALKQEPYDHYCPMMGGDGRFNTWKWNCLEKQNNKVEKIRGCYGGCDAATMLEQSKKSNGKLDPNSDRQRARKMARNGYSVAKIARELKVPTSTVRTYLSQMKKEKS